MKKQKPLLGIEPSMSGRTLTSGNLGPKQISPKVRKFNFIGGSEGVFSDFDNSLWSKSSIYTLCVPLGPKVDATVNDGFKNRQN